MGALLILSGRNVRIPVSRPDFACEMVIIVLFLPRDAMLARYMQSSSCVCPPVYPSQAGTVPKWLHICRLHIASGHHPTAKPSTLSE